MSIDLFSLGKIYPSDFLKPNEQPRCEPIELKLVMEENGLVHLAETAPKEALWGKYWYRSSISTTMQNQLKNIVGEVIELYDLNDGMVWLDIGGNDAYMLSQVPPNITTVNIDPSDDTFKVEAAKKCDLVIQDYFSAAAYKKSKYGHLKANVVSAISMFYDLSNPNDFLNEVFEIMEDDGLLIIQLSYTPLMLRQLEFSNICHEHLYYYCLFNLGIMLEKCGFIVLDAQLNNTNSGSVRIYAMKKESDKENFGSQTYRDVCRMRIDSLLTFESATMVDNKAIWQSFFSRVNDVRKKTIEFIVDQVNKGKKVYGYGASTKFNTVLQYFGLTTNLISAIADRSPAKHGLRCVGSNIPIISEEQMRAEMPDYLLVGPAHFISEFKEREHAFLERGGKFICIMPSFQIIEK
jgi:NDP-4-keto-2,6-dideoxyhexose 3-C-methyltransferase